MRKDDTVYLRHMLDAIERIESYIKGCSYEDFLHNLLLQDGVIRQLEILGEAAGNVSNAFQQANYLIPWGQMIGIRNRLIHAYFNVDITVIWDTVQNDLTPLKAMIEKTLNIRNN